MIFHNRYAVQPYLEVLRRLPKCPWLLSSSYTYSDDAPRKKSKAAPLQERRMIDRFKMRAKGGDGGNGCFSFHRSRHDRRGKVDGGNGGRGGDVILECSHAVWDFKGLQHHVKASRGGNGLSKNKIGSRGGDKVVQVPIGTMIHIVEGEVSYVVENRPLKALDPWEIPDTQVVNHSDSDHKIVANTPTEIEESGEKNLEGSSRLEKTTDMKKTVQDTSGKRLYSTKAQHKICNAENISHSKVSDSEDGDTDSADDGPERDDSEDGDMDSADDGRDWDEVEEDEEEKEEVIHYNVAELTEPGKRVLIAKGGEGGLGNVSLGKISKTNKHSDPQTDNVANREVSDDEDEPSLSVGFPGSETILILELKSLADIGLVGMPNAGKSTLLGAISRAKPTVGHYAFTTLRPSIGKLNYDDFFSVKVADIPGLIKGAHENRGLGHAFLRHIERTKVLAYVVDLAAALDGKKGIPPWEQLSDLVYELESHQEGLSDRPSLIVANKIDEEGAEDVYEELKRRVKGVPIFPVCAVLEEGVPELKAGLRVLVNGGESQRLELDNILLD